MFEKQKHKNNWNWEREVGAANNDLLGALGGFTLIILTVLLVVVMALVMFAFNAWTINTAWDIAHLTEVFDAEFGLVVDMTFSGALAIFFVKNMFWTDASSVYLKEILKGTRPDDVAKKIEWKVVVYWFTDRLGLLLTAYILGGLLL